jgi:thiamine phosphate synthase YjbQ (UPF0047 family)
MEQIIQFLEEYWGISIASGVTVGTLITFIIVQTKSIIINNSKNAELSQALKLFNQVTDKHRELEQRYISLEEKHQYLEQVNIATFKALSFIVVASKLPSEDKIALQNEFSKLTTYAPKTVQAVEKIVEVETKDAVAETIQAVVQTAGSLLTKYIEK